MPQKPLKKKSSRTQRNETLDFNNPDFEFLPKGRHIYRQNGPYLICKSCELTHAIWIGMDKIMVGEDKEGQPILERR